MNGFGPNRRLLCRGADASPALSQGLRFWESSASGRLLQWCFGIMGWVWVGLVGWGASIPLAPTAQEQPTPAQTENQRIQQLIRQLGDKDYFVRQRAQNELAQLGFEAFEALLEAEQHEDFEIAAQAKYLLRLLQVQWTQPGDPPEVKRHLADYPSLPPDQRQQRIHALGAIPEEKGAEALCRLARFERSPMLSKLAAVELIRRHGPDQPPSDSLQALLEKHLSRSRRPAILWLRTFFQFRQSPAQALEDWAKHVEEEMGVFRRSPEQSHPQIVAGLVRYQIRWLAHLGRKKEAAAAMWRLIDLEQKGDPETLTELVEWLLEEKAYGGIEELARRFPDTFRTDPIFLYTLAQAKQSQGQQEQAERTAQEALQLNPGPQAEQIVRHLMAAMSLQRRGLHKWAEQEFRYVIRIAPMGHRLTTLATISLAEMLHDQGEDLRAAEAFKPLVEWFGQRDSLPDALEELNPNGLQARMHYFYSCHWARQGDRTKQKQSLEAALKADPADIDTLIACYRLPEQPPEWKKHIQTLIQKAIEVFREKIQENPDESNDYNHLAWLVGNTEGDLDEALRCVQKAIELAPDVGGYYDTLARVYFARGDLANAIKYQTKAVELEPHSLLIRRQLEEFQKALQDRTLPETKRPSP